MNLLKLSMDNLTEEDWNDIKTEFKNCLLTHLRNSLEETQYCYDDEYIQDTVDSVIREYIENAVKEEVNKILKKNNISLESLILKALKGELDND